MKKPNERESELRVARSVVLQLEREEKLIETFRKMLSPRPGFGNPGDFCKPSEILEGFMQALEMAGSSGTDLGAQQFRQIAGLLRMAKAGSGDLMRQIEDLERAVWR